MMAPAKNPGQKGGMMAIYKEKDHRGKLRYVVSKYWPNGSGRLRKYAPNYTAAKALLTRVEQSILDGTWRELKQELSGNIHALTVREFSRKFIEEYCKPRMRSWKRYVLSFKSLNQHLGKVRLAEFSRQDLHRYIQKRKLEVSSATINRDIACIKKMVSYALDCGVIDHHPLVRFPDLHEPQRAFLVMTLEEVRHLVDSMPDPSLSAMVAVMAETGLRKQEALKLKWDNIDLKNGILTAEETKSGKIRQIPISDYAINSLREAVRYLKCPHVFVNPRTGHRWVNPEKKFKEGCHKAGLDWVGFHDLRRFRATHWLLHGVDVRTVKELLGHADISTTMRYAGYVSAHAVKSVREAQEAEAKEIELAGQETNRRQGSE